MIRMDKEYAKNPHIISRTLLKEFCSEGNKLKIYDAKTLHYEGCINIKKYSVCKNLTDIETERKRGVWESKLGEMKSQINKMYKNYSNGRVIYDCVSITKIIHSYNLYLHSIKLDPLVLNTRLDEIYKKDIINDIHNKSDSIFLNCLLKCKKYLYYLYAAPVPKSYFMLSNENHMTFTRGYVVESPILFRNDDNKDNINTIVIMSQEGFDAFIPLNSNYGIMYKYYPEDNKKNIIDNTIEPYRCSEDEVQNINTIIRQQSKFVICKYPIGRYL